MGCPCPLRRIDLDNVKARLKLTVVFHKPELCRADDTALLGPGDKFARFPMIRIFAELNLNKDNKAAFSGNDVDLPLAAAEIALCNAVAVQAKKTYGPILAPAAEVFFPVHPCRFFRKLIRWIGDGPCSRIAA